MPKTGAHHSIIDLFEGVSIPKYEKPLEIDLIVKNCVSEVIDDKELVKGYNIIYTETTR